MKKLFLALSVLVMALSSHAQPPQMRQGDNPDQVKLIESQAVSSFRLNINTLRPEESQKINNFIDDQRRNRSFLSALGKVGIAALNTIISQTVGIGVSEAVNLIETPQKREADWRQLIQNECNYEKTLTYINNLTDFYSKGSPNGALDPSDFNFNGFTLNVHNEGKEVLRFYSHVDTDKAGLDEIVNHSKFRLVLDSMYFYPYHCHLPNLDANRICVEPGKTYERDVSFNFEERENLTVSIDFTIISSWYNQAIMLAKDVELGTFSINVPIDPKHLTDSVFIYKRTPNDTLSRIAGSSFIVPRSYMPLTGGVPHWGTGEYNVKVTITEHCAVTKKFQDNWKEDYRRIKKMRKKQPFWPAAWDYCVQQGTTLLRCTLNSATSSALKQWDWINGSGVNVGGGSAGGGGLEGGSPGNGGMPNGFNASGGKQ